MISSNPVTCNLVRFEAMFRMQWSKTHQQELKESTMNNAHSALIDITKRRSNRTPKIAAGKTDEQVADELFIGHQLLVSILQPNYDYYDSPECCPDWICQTCGIDHDFRPDFRTR